MGRGADLRAEYQRHVAVRAPWESLWELLARYFLPRKSQITGKRAPGQKQTEYMFDSSGVHSAELLGASLAGALMPPSLKWFSLIARRRELRSVKTVRGWLEDVRDITLLTLSQSNFTSEILEVLLDLVVFGTGALLEEEAEPGKAGRFGGVRFRAMTMGEYTIAEDPFGRVDDLRRAFSMTAKQIGQQWPTGIPAAGKLADALKPGGKAEQEFQVLHSVYPRPYAQARTNRDYEWASCYSLHDEPDVLLSEGGFRRFPFHVPRWAKTSGEIWGRSPAFTALPDNRSLNRAVELYLAAAGKVVDPTILVDDDGVTSTLTLEAAGVVSRRPGAVIEPLESKARFDVARELIEDLRKQIAETFFLDAMRLRFKPNMTATEVMALQEEMLRLLGPTAGRLHSELLGPVIDLTVYLLAQAKQLPEPPQEFLDVEGNVEIDIQYAGPLARAQQSADLQAIDRVQAWRERVAQSTGDTKHFRKFDLDAEGEHYATLSGYPAHLIRDQAEVDEENQRAAEMQAQQAAVQTGVEVAKGAGAAAPMVKALKEPAPGAPAVPAAA